MSENRMPNLAAALAKVQASLPKVERDRTVEVEKKTGGTYSYSYVTLANLSDAMLPLLASHGLSWVTMPGAGSDGKMCVRYLLLHESGEQLAGEFPISGEGGIQMIGGRITYARRYCLAAVTGVAADEDDEARLAEEGIPRSAQRATRQEPANGTAKAEPAKRNTAQRAKPATAGPPLPGEENAGQPVMDAKQRSTIFALWGELGYKGDENREQRLTVTRRVLQLPKLESTSELTPAEAATLTDALRSKLDERNAAEAERRAAEAQWAGDAQ